MLFIFRNNGFYKDIILIIVFVNKIDFKKIIRMFINLLYILYVMFMLNCC